MDDAARIVLALEAQEVAEEVLHFLDRSGLARVVATAADDRQLAEAVRQLEPDVVVAEPALTADHVPGAVPLLALATRESVATLRGAIRAGAQGFFVWPDDRDELLLHVASMGSARRVPERLATVIAVHAARGGAGCTFVATHLAQAFAVAGSACILIDCDLAFGDVTHALGAAGRDQHTMAISLRSATSWRRRIWTGSCTGTARGSPPCWRRRSRSSRPPGSSSCGA